MSKKKNAKRSGLSDMVHQKKSAAGMSKKTNPFEVHVNRQKYTVLNRDTGNDRGLPGVSRAKAAKRRQETLGTEMNELHKTNRFKDNRLGGNRFKSGEDLATAKFAKEMMNRFESKSSKRKGLFNLNDYEDPDGDEPPPKQLLTHKGQTLRDIEQFQDGVSDGDDNDEEDEMLNAEFTDAAHFGGGGGGDDGDDRRSRKDLIDEMISETKRRKAEAAKEKDQVLSMTEKLDAAWKSLIPVVGKLTRTDEVRIKPDAYDRTMREMIFEARGEPTDKLKTKEELAKVEREKLEKLERERLRRMRADAGEEKPKHRSADDLGDEYYEEPLDDDEEEEGGKHLKEWGKSEAAEKEDDEGDDQDEADESSDDDEESDEDNLSDLKSSADEDEDNQEEKEYDAEPKESMKNKTNSESNSSVTPTSTLPFTFDLPDSYEELTAELQKRSPADQSTIVERMIKCNPLNLDSANKDKLISLQAFLCQYINDLFDCDALTESNAKLAFEVFDKMVPNMFQLAEMNSLATGNLLREILTEKQEDVKSKKYPNLDVFMFLKLIGRLFSTSDFKHGVVTPAFVLISQLLTRCSVESGRDIARGLFLATIALDYTAQSKRFLPAVIVFLDGVFRLAVPKETVDMRVPFQFKTAPSLSVAEEKKSKKKEKHSATAELRLTTKDLISGDEIDDSFKRRVLNTATLLAQRFFNIVQDNVGATYYAKDLMQVVERLSFDSYPEEVRTNINSLKVLLDRLQSKQLTRLKARDQPVKQLRMLEPKFEAEQYQDRRKKSGKPTGKALQEVMRHKVKREMKGALRDIKLDNAFVAKMRLNKQRAMDKERRDKVKRIFAEASIQQGELNAIDRQNKRKKK